MALLEDVGAVPGGGAIRAFLQVSHNDDGTIKNGSGGSQSALTHAVTQTAHGFSVGQAVRFNGTAYVLAEADAAADADVDGLVSAVGDANSFTLQVGGYITGLSGLTAGSDYFLSPATAGALTATEPSTPGQVSKPILHADSATSGFVQNMRGLVIPTAAILLRGVQFGSETVTLAVGDGQAHITIDSALNGKTLLVPIFTVSVAPSGSQMSFQLRRSGVDLLSTAATIDVGKTSSETSATPPVVNGTVTLATGDVIFVDVDVIDSGGSSRGAAAIVQAQ